MVLFEVELTDAERLRDSAGKVHPLVVYGERRADGCFFLVSSVASMLEMDPVEVANLLRDETSGFGFEKRRHYINFSLTPPRPVDATTAPAPTSATTRAAPSDLRVLLTYWGLVRLLVMRGNHHIAEDFHRWAIDVLFAVEHGPAEAHNKRAVTSATGPSDHTNVPAASASEPSVVYLFVLGTVKDLRETLDIGVVHDSTHLVVKYGRTEDLRRRTCQHRRNYGKLAGVRLKLKYSVPVDVACQVEAESSLRMFFIDAGWALYAPHQRELAVVSPSVLNSIVRDKFYSVGEQYKNEMRAAQTALKQQQRARELQPPARPAVNPSALRGRTGEKHAIAPEDLRCVGLKFREGNARCTRHRLNGWTTCGKHITQGMKIPPLAQRGAETPPALGAAAPRDAAPLT
jgi:hypothetical protein